MYSWPKINEYVDIYIYMCTHARIYIYICVYVYIPGYIGLYSALCGDHESLSDVSPAMGNQLTWRRKRKMEWTLGFSHGFKRIWVSENAGSLFRGLEIEGYR